MNNTVFFNLTTAYTPYVDPVGVMDMNTSHLKGRSRTKQHPIFTAVGTMTPSTSGTPGEYTLMLDQAVPVAFLPIDVTIHVDNASQRTHRAIVTGDTPVTNEDRLLRTMLDVTGPAAMLSSPAAERCLLVAYGEYPYLTVDGGDPAQILEARDETTVTVSIDNTLGASHAEDAAMSNPALQYLAVCGTRAGAVGGDGAVVVQRITGTSRGADAASGRPVVHLRLQAPHGIPAGTRLPYLQVLRPYTPPTARPCRLPRFEGNRCVVDLMQIDVPIRVARLTPRYTSVFHVPYLWVFIRIPGCTHANQTTYGDDVRGIRTRDLPEWCGGSAAVRFVVRTSRASMASARFSTFLSIPGDRASRVVCDLSSPRGGSAPQLPDVVITDDEGSPLDLGLPTSGGRMQPMPHSSVSVNLAIDGDTAATTAVVCPVRGVMK